MAQLNEFIGALKHGGVRANQFKVFMAPPAGIHLDGSFTFLAKATTLPSLTMGEITVPYRGRQIFITGDRTYDAWELTVLSDKEQNILHTFQDWQDQLGDIGISTSRSGVGDSPSAYYGSATVQQLDRGDEIIRTYYLHQIWPTTVAGYELNYETNDALVEFPVTFRFNYMTITRGGGADQMGIKVSASVQWSAAG